MSVNFRSYLLLNQHILDHYGVRDFDAFVKPIKDDRELEERDEYNVSRFANVLSAHLSSRAQVTAEDILQRYDPNIVRHTDHINAYRQPGEEIRWKYFQYAALLMTEAYLDLYFTDTESLLHALNEHVEAFNKDRRKSKQEIEPFTPSELRKLAFWMATGSGKTLLMHVNILQYKHYLKEAGRAGELNRILLVTTNEGLSQQHRKELLASNIPARIFSGNSATLFGPSDVEIIEIHKLGEEKGDKVVAVDAFEGHNLLLVDEGHRGTSGDAWVDRRNRLAQDGFCFEYSATYKQAIAAQSTNKAKYAYAGEYGKSILVDYSYKRFYESGYGKDYRILNYAEKKTSGDLSSEQVRKLYLTAWLLSFYEQMRLFADNTGDDVFERFHLHRPLALLVGWTVNAIRKEKGREVSDVLELVLFLGEFLRGREEFEGYIERLLTGESGLLDSEGREIFGNAFSYLFSQGYTGSTAYEDIVKLVFNADVVGDQNTLYVERASDEIHLRAGSAREPFGLIYVGDSSQFHSFCEERGDDVLITCDSEFGDTFFDGAKEDESPINILIGSQKFVEGWSSWRVSAIGLLNMARSEGSQAIQLFGRGVRLKGLDYCLKRSTMLSELERDVAPPDHISALETLNVFGINADYMEAFKEYLESEGLTPDEDDIVYETVIPVKVRKKPVAQRKLKTIGLKNNERFEVDGPKMELVPPAVVREDDNDGNMRPVIVDWYPRLQAKVVGAAAEETRVSGKYEEGKLREMHLAFLDWDKLYFEIRRYKSERGYHRLSVSRDVLREILLDDAWYTLQAPPQVLNRFSSFSQRLIWQEMATALLKKYVDQFYKYHKAQFEVPRRRYQRLDSDNANFAVQASRSEEHAYYVALRRSAAGLIERLKAFEKEVSTGIWSSKPTPDGYPEVALKNELEDWGVEPHLFYPLLYSGSDDIVVKPQAINVGERNFIRDLRRHWEKYRDQYSGMELYLLRNRDRVGVGFIEGGNFYPDFIMWLIDGSQQYINFVDPKGIVWMHNKGGIEHDKIAFAHRVKEIEKEMGDSSVTLNSFIVSVTSYEEVSGWRNPENGEKLSIDDFKKHHVFFQKDQCDTYIKEILNLAVDDPKAVV